MLRFEITERSNGTNPILAQTFCVSVLPISFVLVLVLTFEEDNLVLSFVLLVVQTFEDSVLLVSLVLRLGLTIVAEDSIFNISSTYISRFSSPEASKSEIVGELPLPLVLTIVMIETF